MCTVCPLVYVPTSIPHNLFTVYLSVLSHSVSTYICTCHYSTQCVHCVLISFVTQCIYLYMYLPFFQTMCSLCTYQFFHIVYPPIYVPTSIPHYLFTVYLSVLSHSVSSCTCTYQYSTQCVHCVLISLSHNVSTHYVPTSFPFNVYLSVCHTMCPLVYVLISIPHRCVHMYILISFPNSMFTCVEYCICTD